MITATYPTLEIDGKRYVLVPEDVYKEQTTAKAPSKDLAKRFAEMRAGTIKRISADDVNRDMIAGELREDRKNAGLSQAKLSEQSGIRIETISRIEQKKTTARPDTLDKLYKVIDRLTK